MPNSPSLAESVVLVTGASTGVGLHTALAFSKAGSTVVATLRDTAKRGALDAAAREAGVTLAVEALDVQDGQAIAACVDKVVREHGRIDVLVNNAGAGFLGSVEQTSDADLRGVMETNFFGVWNLTKAVLPHMRAAGRGRIITVTSIGGLIGQPFNEAYCAAKFAVEGMMEGLAPLARKFGVLVSMIEPGPINTEFVANVRAASSKILADLIPPYDRLLGSYMAASTDVFAKYGQTGEDIAGVIVSAASDAAPHLRYVTSDFARAVVAPKVVDYTGDNVVDAFAARLGG